MTQVYEQNEIQLVYPENWKLTENHSAETLQINIESPNGCSWDLFVVPVEATREEWMGHLLETMAEQYDSFEQEVLTFELGDHELQGYECFFYYLDLLISVHVFSLPSKDGKNRFVMFQAESREFDSNLEVMRAMTMSLLR